MFQRKKKVQDKEMFLILADLSKLYAEVVGDITLVFHDKYLLTLKRFVYVTKMRRNLTLTLCLYEMVIILIFLIECLF